MGERQVIAAEQESVPSSQTKVRGLSRVASQKR